MAKTYTQLRDSVRQVIVLGKQRAEQAVEREKVRTCWQVGNLILEHILLNKKRGKYGAEVLKRLARDLKVGIRELRYMVEFARTYPKLHTSAVLSWAHYKVLLGVNDKQAREEISARAVKGDWSVAKLRAEMKKLKTNGAYSAGRLENAGYLRSASGLKGVTVLGEEPEFLEEPRRLKPGRREIIKATEVPDQGKLVYDLGFSNYYRPKRLTFKKIPKEECYFYDAYVVRVVDGDTLWVTVDLSYGFRTLQKLRLRALNAPELNRKAGQLAKKYLQRKLKTGTQILIRTVKSDKFDRYLADVWFQSSTQAKKNTTSADYIYLNAQLVQKGHASVVS